jgi:hypothetical protein
MLYKYRGLSNLKLALDILVNRRLYAADTSNLNDPMEGMFVHTAGPLAMHEIQEIWGGARDLRVSALSRTPGSTVMWAHYAEAHRGIVVGLDIVDTNADVVEVDYVDDLTLDRDAPDLARRILTKKLKAWAYEQEVRVLVRSREYVKIRPRELLFGLATSEETRSLVTAIARKFCPKLKITKLSLADLDEQASVGAIAD